MKTNFFNIILLIVFVTLSACSVQAAGEQELIAILQSSAGPAEKCAACQQLRIYGTVQSVPALAALLGQERVGHAARYALEDIPGPEAGAALRKALTKNSGLTKAGLINSLGWRRDADSVPLLVPLISDADVAIAKETASALGRIGGEKAIAALIAARENSNPAVRLAVLEALLGCAENRLRAGDKSGAKESEDYERQYRTEHPFPYAALADFVDHVDHVVELVGIDHVGLGSDFEGVSDTLPVGLKDVSQYPNLVLELLKRGYSEEEIAKICSGNLMRVWSAVEACSGQEVNR